MAQLIKVNDYISRYQKDMFHYSSQFTRLKMENWNKIYQAWLTEQEVNEDAQVEEDAPSILSRWKQFFKRREQLIENVLQERQPQLPADETELKHYFLDTLLPFQLKWASTTVSEMSFIDKSYYEDFTLKYFIQRFPDTYFLLYEPIFKIKNSPVEADIIFVSPIGLEIIKLVEFDSSIKIIADNNRVWKQDVAGKQTDMLSPIISLNRTEKIVKSILLKYELTFPIQKIVLSRTNRIEFFEEPYHTSIIDVNHHEEWFHERRNLVSPIKHQQLKVCDALLRHCSTVAVKRPEWDEDTQTQFT